MEAVTPILWQGKRVLGRGISDVPHGAAVALSEWEPLKWQGHRVLVLCATWPMC